jgi:hypothetical protein
MIIDQLEGYIQRGEALGPKDLKDLAVLAGIASDKYLDLTQGRAGRGAHVDARQQTVRVIWENATQRLVDAHQQRSDGGEGE